MSSVKPTLSTQSVIALLENEFKSPISGLTSSDSGMIAQTYRFSVGEKEYYVQFNYKNMSQGNRTERFFADRLSQNGVPVRKFVKIDVLDGLHYAISEKLIGQAFDKLDYHEFELTLPSVIDVLFKIGTLNIEDSVGYGWLNKQYNGQFKSWPEHLAQIRDQEPGDFYDNWHHLFETTFLERKLFDYYFSKMEQLFQKLPVKREFVHSGFGYSNVLVKNHKVTAVIDWQDARYGDSVFDLAYMIFWRQPDQTAKCIEAFKKYAGKNTSLDNLEERISCYQYYTGLDGMRFSAKTNNHDFYKLTLKLLESI